MKKVSDLQEPTGPNQSQGDPNNRKPKSFSSEFGFVIVFVVIVVIIVAVKALGLF